MNIKVIYPPDTKGGKTREYGYQVPDGGNPLDLMEIVYRQFNRGDGTEHIFTAGLKERSLSVGDMAEINGQTYVVDRLGCKPISAAGKERLLAMDFAERQFLHDMPA